MTEEGFAEGADAGDPYDVDRQQIGTSANGADVPAAGLVSWETPPPPIPEEQIAETIETEVVIVGGGMAGLAMAARLGELGIGSVVLEKFRGLVGRGGHIASVGSRVQRDNGVFIDKEQFARDWMRISGSRVNEDLLWMYINRSEEAFDWLLELGGDNIVPQLFGGNYRGPDFTEYAGTHFLEKTEGSKYKFGGALLICEILEDKALAGGTQLLRNTRVLQLEKTDGRVTAALAQDKEGVVRRYRGRLAVVLATGDIGGNPEMVAQFSPLGLLPKRNGYYPPGLNTGDGHKMGVWAGGALENAPWALSLHLIAYGLFSFFFLHVNRRGKRFMNEDTWVQAKAIRILSQPQGDWAYSVFDDKWFEEVAARAQYSGGQFTDPLIIAYGEPWDNEKNNVRDMIATYVRNGICCKADTLEELAAQMDVPPDTFKKTVARYNEMAAKGHDDDYAKRPVLLTSIGKPPYYALKVGPAMLTIFGGLLTDLDLHVLDKNHDPIPGLLAVGNVAGGMYGVDYPLLLNGNSHCRNLVWARTAAETIRDGRA